MALIKNPPMMNTGGGAIEVANGTISSYLSYGEDLAPNTFVGFVDDDGTIKVQVASSAINGLTHTACTTTTAGEVYVL